LKQSVKNIELQKRIFAASPDQFNELAIELFKYQYENNSVYRQYCDLLKVQVDGVHSIQRIPFLPISFFKTHEVKTTAFEAETVFESSGTTGSVNSKHFIKDVSIYRESFTTCFEKFYGPAKHKCILGLLPSYLERNNSSLIRMTQELISAGSSNLGGFYLYDHEKLHRTIIHNELLKVSSLLIGVTYALLDFAEQYPMRLNHTIVMETGGMKGRRKEMTRQQVHEQLQSKLGVSLVHSEYGMTELLSQAYSLGNGIFECPSWIQIHIRDTEDALTYIKDGKTGGINVIDLANINSCSFIATQDLRKKYPNTTFEVLGRFDNSDIRGCNLMVV